MRIKITRNAGLLGKFRIKVDGKNQVEINANETREIKLDNSEATLQAYQLGAKTNELTVSHDDHILITMTTFGEYGSFLWLIFSWLFIFVQNTVIAVISLLLATTLLASMFIFEGSYFQLEKKEKLTNHI